MKLSSRTQANSSLAILAGAIITAGSLSAYVGIGYKKDPNVVQVERLAKKGNLTLKKFVEELGKLDAEGVVFAGCDIIITPVPYYKSKVAHSYDAMLLIRTENEKVAADIQSAFTGEFRPTPGGGKYLVC